MTSRPEQEVDAFLRDLLDDGPKPAYSVFAAGADHGFGDRQLRRAADRLGVVREGSPGTRTWRLSGQVSGQCPDSLPGGFGAGVRTTALSPVGGAGCPDTPDNPAGGPFYFISHAGGRFRFRSHRPHHGEMIWPPAEFVAFVERDRCLVMADSKID